MIRPELWSNEQFVELSTNARLLYIAMWNFCDDGGNHPATPKTLKMETHPGDDITTADITTLINEIIQKGLITPYTANQRPYWHITNWQNLQKIDRPNPIHPTPFDDHSTTTHRADDENPQIKEIKEINKKREERESAPAHEEEENSKQKNATPTNTQPEAHLPPHGGAGGGQNDPYTHCIHHINQWAKPDDWQPLRHYAASVGYDPTQYGPVADEVKKFTAHWLDPKRHPHDRAAFQADPAQFFQQKGRKWLLDAKTMNKPPKPNARPYTRRIPGEGAQRTNNAHSDPKPLADITQTLTHSNTPT